MIGNAPINNESAVPSLSVAVAAAEFINQWPEVVKRDLQYTYDLARRSALQKVIRLRDGKPDYTLPGLRSSRPPF